MKKIFISSTAIDLPEYRKAAIEICQRVGLQPIAMEDFGADPRQAVAVCLGKVDEASFFLGVYAHRYGWTPPGSEISITEMEYERAMERELPVYLYVADRDHPWPPSQVDLGENAEKLKQFKRRIGGLHTYRKFRDVASFREDLIFDLDRLVVSQPPEEGGRRRRRPPIPAPPAMHSVPPYVTGHPFVGRAEELAEFDAWGRSADTVRVVEAIGGMGKSALTWEWARTRAADAIADLAGIVWWSFYEGGASTVSFVREALAYVLGEDPEALLELDSEERAQRLLTELARRPYLLVLDGFERLLTAYHRHDPSKLRDEEVEVELRACTAPRDGDLLRRLVACGPSKVLISSRLMPRELENRAHQPIPGVSRRELRGLAPDDAVELLRRLEVRGDSARIKDFLGQFDHHSLLVGVVAGLVRDHRPAPGNFDRWLTDARASGGLRLAELDLKQRRTHILAFAYGGLAPEVRRLLSRIAVFSDAVDYPTLSILNPYLPPDPDDASSPPDPALPEARDVVTKFHAALGELEDRGLLQWNRATGTYDLHPVVRGYAFDLLEEPDRVATYDRIRDHFESLPPEDPNEATELDHLRQTLMIYRALVGAGRRDEAVRLFMGDVGTALLSSIASASTVLELLKPLFPEGFQKPPALSRKRHQSYVMNHVGLAFSYLGRDGEAHPIVRLTLKIDTEERNWSILPTELRNYAIHLVNLRRVNESRRSIRLSHDLALASGERRDINMSFIFLARDSARRGQWAEAWETLEAFDKNVFLPRATYRPGFYESVRCELKYLQGDIERDEISDALTVAERGKSTEHQQSLLYLRTKLALREGDPAGALDDAERALALARKSGAPLSLGQGLMARILARQGRHDEARVLIDNALEASRQWSSIHWPDCDAAEVYLEIGDRERAGELALAAYELAWADGPPYSFWEELQRSRAVLADLGIPEPELAPFDPERVEPIPFEVEIRKVIEELEAKKRR